MDRNGTNITVTLIYCLAVLAMSGCSNRTTWPAWMPGSIQLDQVPGVAPPSERVNSLREEAKNAEKMDLAEKEQAARDLAGEIRKEEDPILRTEILRTLSVIGGPTADSVLRLAISDPDADVRAVVCGLWGKREGPETVKLLSGVLASDSDKDVRMAAARSLGKTHDKAAIAALGGALDDSDPAMQYTAVNSLHDVTGQDLGNDVDRWRQYVKNESTTPEPAPSWAERFRRAIY